MTACAVELAIHRRCYWMWPWSGSWSDLGVVPFSAAGRVAIPAARLEVIEAVKVAQGPAAWYNLTGR